MKASEHQPKPMNTPGGSRFRQLWYLTFYAEQEMRNAFVDSGLPLPWPRMTMDWFQAWMMRNREMIEGKPNEYDHLKGPTHV